MKAIRILRLALLALAAAAVAGCVTSPGYGYRGGQGDYYYGQPSVDYRYRGGYGPYHGGYGYPYGYGRSGLSIGVHYGHPYYRYGYGARYGHPWYGHPWYGWPYYGYPYYRPPVVVRPRPDDSSDVPPWRDLDRLRELERNRRVMDIESAPMRPDVARTAPPPRPTTVRTETRSRIGSNVERARTTSRVGREQED